MRYVKVTTTSANLLRRGYPAMQFYEIDSDECVVRAVMQAADGSLLKESLSSMQGIIVGKSLRDEAPSVTDNREGAPGFVEESIQNEFEDVWRRADWHPDGKAAGN